MEHIFIMNRDTQNLVAMRETEKKYPSFPYPPQSPLFDTLKKVLGDIGLDTENPFGSLIQPGQTVVIKPNWVRDSNPLGYNTDSLITHSSLVYYVIRLLGTAMQGTGTVVIGDAPLQNCNWELLQKETRIQEVLAVIKTEFPDLVCIVEDWRITKLSNAKDTGVIQKQKIQEDAWEKEYALVDLGTQSFLEEVSDKSTLFRVTKYKPSVLQKHHAKGKHEYLVTKRIEQADLIINMPKVKTHIKAGLTGALKNLVGINGHKEFLPHHRKGAPADGGDNYPHKSHIRALYEWLYDITWEHINTLPYIVRRVLFFVQNILWKMSIMVGNKDISAGSWSGNDTVWRTTLDLNRIAYQNNTKVIHIADGIIAGEKEGPLEPSPKPLGLLFASSSAASLDATIATLFGYDLQKIPTVWHGLHDTRSIFYTKNETAVMYNGTLKNLHTLESLSIVVPRFWQDALKKIVC